MREKKHSRSVERLLEVIKDFHGIEFDDADNLSDVYTDASLIQDDLKRLMDAIEVEEKIKGNTK